MALAEQVLKILDDNCILTPAQIAAMLGSDENTIAKTISELEEKGILLGYNAMINWDKTESDKVTALIDLRVTPQRGEGFDKVAEKIYKFPQVRSLFLTSGGYDLLVVIEGSDMKSIALFVAETLSTMDNVISTTTHFVLKKYKDHGVIFENNEVDDRQVITL